MRLRPHPESKPPSRHGGCESPRNRQRQKLLGQALSACALFLPLRMNAIRVALVIALFGMAWQHQRMVLLFVLITPMLMATPIANALEQKPVLNWRHAALVAMIAITIVGAIFGAEFLAWPIAQEPSGMLINSDGDLVPVHAELKSALETVPPALRSHRVYNDGNYGPLLIGAHVAVFIDDRSELYGDEPTSFAYSWLDEQRIDWAVADPNANPGFIAALNADPKWSRLYLGRYVSIFARKSALDAVKAGGS
jgi:hypothetical protein